MDVALIIKRYFGSKTPFIWSVDEKQPFLSVVSVRAGYGKIRLDNIVCIVNNFNKSYIHIIPLERQYDDELIPLAEQWCQEGHIMPLQIYVATKGGCIHTHKHPWSSVFRVHGALFHYDFNPTQKIKRKRVKNGI